MYPKLARKIYSIVVRTFAYYPMLLKLSERATTRSCNYCRRRRIGCEYLLKYNERITTCCFKRYLYATQRSKGRKRLRWTEQDARIKKFSEDQRESWMIDDEQEERGGRGREESKTTETRRGERACKTENKTESKRAASKCTK